MRKVLYQWAGVGILSFIGWGVDVMPGNTSWIPSVALWTIAGLWFAGTLVYWGKNRGKKQPEIIKGTKSENLTDILTEMHKQMMHLKAVRLKQRFDKRHFEDNTPLFFDKIGLIELNDWDKFEKKLASRIRQRIPKSPEKQAKIGWRYRVTGEAKKIVKELVSSKEWEISDVEKVAEYLDNLHIGLEELRDNDEKWQGLFEKTKPYLTDSILRELIDKHISHSYAFSSTSLMISYSSRLPKNSIKQSLYSALVGSNISPTKIDIALSEILEEITKRLEMLGERLPIFQSIELKPITSKRRTD